VNGFELRLEIKIWSFGQYRHAELNCVNENICL